MKTNKEFLTERSGRMSQFAGAQRSLLLEGKDVVGRSQTGTGKTAAFGLPAVDSIDRSDSRSVQVLILCPTRELAMQACDEMSKFSKYMPWVKPCAVYGGADIDRQIVQLKRPRYVPICSPFKEFVRMLKGRASIAAQAAPTKAKDMKSKNLS